MQDVSPASAASADRRKVMVDCQVRTFDVTDIAVLDALQAVPRERFVGSGDVAFAYSDAPLTVSSGKARRQMLLPMVLARLLQNAGVTASSRVLDVGGGNGYSAAVLAQLAGSVTALESEAGFSAAANGLFAELGLTNARAITGPLAAGAPAQGPFDVFLVNGAVEAGLEQLLASLAPGGRLLVVTREPGQVGLSGKATRFDRAGADFSSKFLFDAAGPALEGFARQPAFVF